MKRILGIDYGLKKIGLALGVGDIVRPYAVLDNKTDSTLERKAIERIVNIVLEEKINRIVIGLPLLHGEETPTSKRVKMFGDRLGVLIPDVIEISYVDESESSKDALKVAVKSGVSKKRRKNNHALEACEIIKRYHGIIPRS